MTKSILPVVALVLLTQTVPATAQRKSTPSPKSFKAFEAFSIPQAQLDEAFSQKILEEIEILTGLAKKEGNKNTRSDYLFRIADAYLLFDKANYFRAMEKYNKDYDAFMSGKIKTEPVEPKISAKKSYTIYKNIIDTNPSYGRIDEVLFLAGYYGEQLEDSKGVDHLYTLVRKYPNSRYFLDAWMEIGDHHFQRRELPQAIKAYKTVLTRKSRIYNFALYKLAWCYYNQGEIRAAMQVMQKVVQASKGIANEIELREEALRDLVLFYSDLGLIDEAEKYFVSIGEPEYAFKVLEKLANIYFDQSRFDKAISTLDRLLKKRPLHQTAPRYHSKLIESYEKSQQLPQAMMEMERYVVLYDENSEWHKQNQDVDAREYAAQRSEVYARFLPKKFHEEAQKVAKTRPEDSIKLQRRALYFYKRYLDRFGNHANAYDMRFLYAELLFKLDDYQNAALEFNKVVKADSKGKHRKAALIGQIDALTKLEDVYFKDLEVRGIKSKSKFDPIPLSDFAKALITADELYLKWFPDDLRVPDVLLHRGQTYYKYNQFDPALNAFGVLINQHPNTGASDTARHLVLDIYNIRKDWENLEKYATSFLKNKHFATAENRSLLLKLIQGSIFQRAKGLEEKRQYVPAAEMYLRLTSEYPDSEYADKALFNAAIDYINADASDKAMVIAKRFLSKYPKSDLVPKMLLAMASYFDDKLDYANAAYYYELLAENDPKSSLASDALFNAGLYRENLKHYKKALENYETYLKRYPSAKDASEIYFSTGVVHEKQKNYRAAAEIFFQFPRRYGHLKDSKKRIVEAYYRRGQALDRLGKGGEAYQSYANAITLFKKYNKDPSLGPNVGSKFAAKSKFEVARDEKAEFERIRLRMPQARLARDLESKARLLQNLKNHYLEIITYGDAETGVAALYELGRAYQNFSSALFAAPVPAGLTSEEVAIYQMELQNRAAPIEQKAVEAYESAVKKAYELGVYTKPAKLSFQQLTQFRPDAYPPIRGRTIYQTHLSEPIAPVDASATKGASR